jgi:hypothetical protein
MKRLPYRFEVQLPRSHLIIVVSDEGISIKKICAVGAGKCGDFDDAYKIEVIGRVASARQIWNLRMKGYTEIADGAQKAYGEKRLEESQSSTG